MATIPPVACRFAFRYAGPQKKVSLVKGGLLTNQYLFLDRENPLKITICFDPPHIKSTRSNECFITRPC